MKYEEIVDMWAVDAAIDIDCLDRESLKIPLLQGKYFNLYCREKAILSKLNLDLSKLRKWKRDYFLGDISPEELAERGTPAFPKRIVKSDLESYVDTDAEVISFLEKIAVCQTKVDLLHLIVKAINDRQWNIRNAIEFLKYKNGI